MGGSFEVVRESIMARAAAQVAAVERVGEVEGRRAVVRAQLRELDDEYARVWGAALKDGVAEVELRKVGEVPGVVPKRRASRSKRAVEGAQGGE